MTCNVKTTKLSLTWSNGWVNWVDRMEDRNFMFFERRALRPWKPELYPQRIKWIL